MKYKGFKYFIDWKWFVIFPTITILKDEPQYLDKNFSIQFHWLGFHLRWFWIKEFKSENFVSVEILSDYQARLEITNVRKGENDNNDFIFCSECEERFNCSETIQKDGCNLGVRGE